MNTTKKVLSVMLAVLMAVTAVPFAVFAEQETTPCAHTKTATKITKQPTCSEEGQVDEICKTCGDVVFSKVLDKADHSFKGEFKNNADGTHSQKCENCDVYSEPENCSGGKATCQNKAVCTSCNTEYGEVDPEGHKWAPQNATDATCTQAGNSAYNKCEYCDKEESKTVIEPLGHKFEGPIKANNNGTHSYKCINPGCEEYGNPTVCVGGVATCTVRAICQDCKAEYGEINPDNHTGFEKVEEVTATCLNPGHNEYKHCTSCKTDVGREDYPQLSHNFSDIQNCINNGNGTHSYKCKSGCNGYGVGTIPYEKGGFVVCAGGTATCVFKAVCSACKKEYGEVDPNNHPNDRIEYIPGKGASCNEAGYETYKHCFDCGKDIGKNNIPQLDHKFTGVSRSNGNSTHSFRCVYGCGTYGGDTNCVDNNKDCICDVCGYKFDHIFTNYIYDEGSATCLNDGTKTALCSVCAKASDTVPDEGSHTRVDHTYVTYISNSDATCTENGTKSAVCEICRGYPITVEDEDSALGHAYNHYMLDEGSATCLENGTETSKCDRCDSVNTHEAKGSALGHSFTNYVYNNDAECLKNGTETSKCDRCEETDTRTAVNTALHHYESDELKYPDDFDCTIGGIAYIKCLLCEAVMGEKVVKATDHIIVDDPEVAPTCNAEGKTAGSHCVICKKIIVAQESIEKTSHAFGKWEPTVAATCLESGKETRTCSICGGKEERTVGALGHDFSSNWTVDEKSTCIKEGTKSHHCKRCDARTDITKAEKAAHKYVTVVVTQATAEKNGKASKKCSVCAATTSASKVVKIGTVKLSKTSYAYDGKVKKPTVTVKDANGTKLKSGVDYKVKYSSGRKQIGTYTVKITFIGKYSGTKKLTFKIVPQAVTTITATTASKQASLSWSKAKGAQKYVIYYATSKNGPYKKLGVKDVTSCTVKNLASGKTYYFKVKAFKKVNSVNYYAKASLAVKVKVK